jgi:hypothetical protein
MSVIACVTTLRGVKGRRMLRTHLLWTSTSLKGALVDLFILVEGRQNRRGGRGSGAAMHPKQAQTFQA